MEVMLLTGVTDLAASWQRIAISVVVVTAAVMLVVGFRSAAPKPTVAQKVSDDHRRSA